MSGECAICYEHCLDCQCFIFKEEMMIEEVNHPNHYQGKTFEAIDIIEDYDLNFNLGNALKYILRCEKTGCRQKDLEKAIWYLQREVSDG
jgi:hypothetical protein